MSPRWGEIWWGERPNRKPRPFLILSRDRAIPVLVRVMAAPVSSTVRGIPTEVPLGPGEGLPIACAASLDNVTTIRKAFLTRRLGTIDQVRRREVCDALAAAIDC